MKNAIHDRNVGLDFLKIVATVMVVVLHVNGYLTDIIPFENFSFGANIVWHAFEAFSYPAIHLFVMITAWFTIGKKFSAKRIINVWFQTWCICILGLVCAIFFHYCFGLKELFVVIFPFTGRAYWYVTDYIILMLFSPVLNIVIEKLSIKQLVGFSILLFFIESVFACFLSILNWSQDYSNIGLFVLLYFLVAVLKKNINIIQKKWGGCIWIASFSLLFGSYVILHYLGNNVNIAFKNMEMFFFQYDSPLVIFEAIGLMILFAKINISLKNEFVKKLIQILVNASLVVYLVHMHPIIKEHYVSNGVLSWVNVNDFGIYVLETVFCVQVVFVVGVILSIPITKLSSLVYRKIESRIDVFNRRK